MKNSPTLTIALFVSMFGLTAPATLVSLPATADTFIELGDFDDTSANHGSDPSIALGRSSVFTDFAMLIRFDVGAIPSGATINSATLSLFAGANPYGASDQFELSHISEDWNENTVSGDTAPVIDVSTLTVGAAPNPSINVILFVEDWVNNGVSNYGLYIQNTSFDSFGDFVSREGLGANPSLQIDYAPIPEPSSFALAFLGVLGLLKWIRGLRV